MKTYVLDASVAIAWYLPEAFSMDARRWQQRFLDGEIAFTVPALHYLEVGNVLRTYVRRGEVQESVAEELYGLHLEAPMGSADAPPDCLLRTALDYGSTVYDAAYIALSLHEHIPLLTGERTTTPWVVKLGDQVTTLTLNA